MEGPTPSPSSTLLDASRLYFALDAKPKRVPPERLRRVRNITQNPRVAVLVDDYREDWRRLAYVLLEGDAAVLPPGAEKERALALLRAKYRQYRGGRLPPTRPSSASRSSEPWPGEPCDEGSLYFARAGPSLPFDSNS